MLTLGIETSCDETSIAIVEAGKIIRTNLISSQIGVHRRFGGVVPEVASRKHLEAFPSILEEALTQARLDIRDIGQIAVTAGPGLLGSLLIGVSAAKALAWHSNVPLIPVNHLEAHLSAAFLAAGREPIFPFLGLIVSGGHSSLVISENHQNTALLGATVDDAPGELFDKIARFLGLGYPGGPEIQKVGINGDPSRYSLPRPLKGQGYRFSFSGLKTAVINLVQAEGKGLDLPGLCASLQMAVAETLCSKVETALSEHRLPRMVVAGGVAANARLRTEMEETAKKHGVDLFIPPLELCTDNAAMVAARGFFTAPFIGKNTLSINAVANWAIGTGTEIFYSGTT